MGIPLLISIVIAFIIAIIIAIVVYKSKKSPTVEVKIPAPAPAPAAKPAVDPNTPIPVTKPSVDAPIPVPVSDSDKIAIAIPNTPTPVINTIIPSHLNKVLSPQEIQSIIDSYTIPAIQVLYTARAPGYDKTSIDGFLAVSMSDKLLQNNKYLNISDTVYNEDKPYIRSFAYTFKRNEASNILVYGAGSDIIYVTVNGSFIMRRNYASDSDIPVKIMIPDKSSVVEVLLLNYGGGIGAFMLAVYDESGKLLFNTASPGWMTK